MRPDDLVCRQPGKRQPMSPEQRAKLSTAQKEYVANDPRWAEHRRKLAAAQEARRMTLMESEVAMILDMRRRGRTFSYIAEEIGICHDVIRRELKAIGITTERVKANRRARRGRGFWRCFDDGEGIGVSAQPRRRAGGQP